ncbi:hypothetical protein [Lysinibacillus sphaericus]
MQIGREYYQMQDSYFLIIHPIVYVVIGVLAFIGITLCFVWKRKKRSHVK